MKTRVIEHLYGQYSVQMRKRFIWPYWADVYLGGDLLLLPHRDAAQIAQRIAKSGVPLVVAEFGE